MSDIEKERAVSPPHMSDEERVGPALRDPDAHLSDEERAEVVSLPTVSDAAQNDATLRNATPILTCSQDRKLVRRLDFMLIPWV